MKTKVLFVFALAFALVSCKTKEDPTPEPEPVVLGQLSNVELLPGNGRFQVNGSSSGLNNVTAIEIAVDGKTFNAPLDHSTPSFSYVCEGISAGNQNVSIKSVGENDAASEPASYTVNVYDDSIASSYTAKEISDAQFLEDDMSMTLTFTAPEGISYATLSYKDGEGADKTLDVDVTATTLVLYDWQDECTVVLTSFVKPFENALDDVSVGTSQFVLPKIVITPDEEIALANTTFANAQFSSDIVGGQYSWNTLAIGLWDGEKYWPQGGYHSSDGDGVPHHISFDLGVKAKLTCATIYFRGDGGWTDWPPRKLQVWGHPDFADGEDFASIDVADSPTRDNAEFISESEGKGWILLGEYEPTEEELSVNMYVTVRLDDTTPVRFFRYRIVEGWKEPHVGPGMYGNATEIELTAWKKSIKPIN